MGAQGTMNILYRRELAEVDGRLRRSAGAVRRLRGAPGQSLHRGGARLRGLGDPAVVDADLRRQGPACPPDQAPDRSAKEAREHTTVTFSNPGLIRTHITESGRGVAC